MDQSLEVRAAGAKGLGVFTLRSFGAGERVLLATRGRILTVAEAQALTAWEQDHLAAHGPDHYELMTAPGCYVNHSCDPNTVGVTDGLIALRPIAVGDEITADYRVDIVNEGWEMACQYGSPQCSGTVYGDFFTMPPELQARYLAYVSPTIAQQYGQRHATTPTAPTVDEGQA